VPKYEQVVPRLALPLAVFASVVLLAPAPAAARTASQPVAGIVVGGPEARGARVVVPVLLTAASARRTRLQTPVVRVSVPADGGLRSLMGLVPADDLRLGDGVAAEGLELPADAARAVRPRLRARTLRLRERATVASFAAFEAAIAAGRDALAAAGRRLDAKSAAGARNLRHELVALREQLVLLDADLHRLAGAVAAAEHHLARRTASSPGAAGRHAAERRALRDGLAASRAATQRAGEGLAQAVAALDAVLAGLDPEATTVPAPAGPALRAALRRAEDRLEALAPLRFGPPRARALSDRTRGARARGRLA